MKTQRQYLRTLVLPILLALVAVGLVDVYVHGRSPKPSSPGPVPTTSVVVVQENVPARTVLRPAMLATKTVPAAMAAGTSTRMSGVLGRVTKVPLVAGDWLLSGDIAQGGTHDALSFTLPPGKEALAISASEVSSVAGFIEPGDTVDVLAFFGNGSSQPNEDGLVATDVRVLAVAQSRTSSGQPTDLKKLTSVTLEVTPSQGSRIFFAEEKGVITLMLRGATDQAPTAQVTTTGTQAFAKGH